MSSLTNTGEDVLQRGLGVCEVILPRPASLSLEDMYETCRCVAWVKHGQYKKVCLQFPDELLGDAFSVAQLLTRELDQLVYVLGDTTFGSCCVDEVAAEHVGADSVIHFGHTCLTPSQRLPTLLIPTRLPLDIPGVAQRIKTALEEDEEEGGCVLGHGATSCNPVLLLDTRCHYAAESLFSELKKSLPTLIPSRVEGLWQQHEEKGEEEKRHKTGTSENSKRDKMVCIGSEKALALKNIDNASGTQNNNYSVCNQKERCINDPTNGALRNCESSHSSDGSVSSTVNNESQCSTSSNSIDVNAASPKGEKEVRFGGRCVCLPQETSLRQCTFIYVGPEGPTLDSMLLRFPQNTFYHAPTTQAGRVTKLSGMKSLIRRSIKLEMVRDASIIGILVGTLGVTRYKEAIARLKTIIKAAGKRCYTFLVGKPNEPKLANVSEVDVFVYVACPETTFISRDQDPVVYRKLVAPWEVEVALVSGREGDMMSFEPDFRAMLPGGSRHVEVSGVPREEEVAVSLITNKTQTLGVRDSSGGEERTAGAVMVAEGRALATLHVGGGGQVLGGRSWAGLDPSQPPPTLGPTVVEGRSGIASEYQHEKI